MSKTFTGLRERRKRGKSEEKIDCHHQNSDQGSLLVASDALATELWCNGPVIPAENAQPILQTSSCLKQLLSRQIIERHKTSRFKSETFSAIREGGVGTK